MTLTEEERRVIDLLLDTVDCALLAMDDAEELHDATYLVGSGDADRLITCLERLEELSDDRPGYTLGPAGKAQWALRRLFEE